jgi:hypothetical protein
VSWRMAATGPDGASADEEVRKPTTGALDHGYVAPLPSTRLRFDSRAMPKPPKQRDRHG